MKKMNNKGFSLVELIIVIAIMAILIVVLAPQYLKYVEKSRNSTDLQNATEIVTALQVYAADPEANPAFQKNDVIEIEVKAAGGTIKEDTHNAGAKALTEAAITIADIKCSSKTNWQDYTIKGVVQADGSIKFTYSGTDFDKAMKGNSASGT